jgi:hypothetical protein
MTTDSPRGNNLALCPQCEATLNDFSSMAGNKDAHPCDGSLSVCAYCGAYLAFRADLTVRRATPVEVQCIDEALNETYEHQFTGETK